MLGPRSLPGVGVGMSGGWVCPWCIPEGVDIVEGVCLPEGGGMYAYPLCP